MIYVLIIFFATGNQYYIAGVFYEKDVSACVMLASNIVGGACIGLQ